MKVPIYSSNIQVTSNRAFGITLGTTILQNGLKSRLPTDFLQQFPNGAEISYAIIPIIRTLPEPLQSQVKAAFGSSISIIWLWVVGLGGLGLLLTLPMQQLTLHIVTDEAWGLHNDKSQSTDTALERGDSKISEKETTESNTAPATST